MTHSSTPASSNQPDDNLTEFIRCEHCARVFDHDSSCPGSFHCPYCGGRITEDSPNVLSDGGAL